MRAPIHVMRAGALLTAWCAATAYADDCNTNGLEDGGEITLLNVQFPGCVTDSAA